MKSFISELSKMADAATGVHEKLVLRTALDVVQQYYREQNPPCLPLDTKVREVSFGYVPHGDEPWWLVSASPMVWARRWPRLL